MRVNHPQNVDQKCISRQWPSSAARKMTLAVARAKGAASAKQQWVGMNITWGRGRRNGVTAAFCWNRSRSKKHSNIYSILRLLCLFNAIYILLISSYLLERPLWSYCSYCWYLWTADCLFEEQLIRNWMYTGFYTQLHLISITHTHGQDLGNYAITG